MAEATTVPPAAKMEELKALVAAPSSLSIVKAVFHDSKAGEPVLRPPTRRLEPQGLSAPGDRRPAPGGAEAPGAVRAAPQGTTWAVKEEGGATFMDLNMGPQHPSTHGVLRLKLSLEGEMVRRCEPVLGYLHRSKEKIAEFGQWIKFIPISDRMDYLAALHNNMGLCRVVEDLGNLEVPPRAQYIRTITMELNRLSSHYLWIGTFGLDLGAITPYFYAFRDREECLTLIEEITGARITISYFRFGGVKWDVPDGWLDKVLARIDILEKRLDEIEDLLTENDIFVIRTKGTGRLDRETCVNVGGTGPMLRASGVEFDLRKAEPYAAYDKVHFDVPYETTGDNLARWKVRLAEMRQSFRILRQACKAVPGGPYIAAEYSGGKVLRVKVPHGEAYSRIEAPRGELGYYAVSDNDVRPYRLKVRGHSFSNLQLLPYMAEGVPIADLVVTLGNIDIVLGDIDR